MKTCGSCEQHNPDEANFCSRCGSSFSSSRVASEPVIGSTQTDAQLWEAFIGPSKSIQFSRKEGWSWRPASQYYLEKFKYFDTPAGPRFAWSWNWPAFLFDPFLWFLYRKMYLYALLYAVGPVLSVFLTGDMSVGIVWRMMAGASANYIYYWHVKDHLQRIKAEAGLDTLTRIRLVKENGGIQPYVLWLGLALHLLMVGLIIGAIEQGPPSELPVDPQGDDPQPKFF